ncbi:hypothetical protein BH10PSE13_BH10PSE13_12240 [soil metagenome]
MALFNNKLYWLTSAASLVCAAAAAHAQTDPQPQTGTQIDDTANAVGDIIVTARRRAESMQSVPVAITAITSETLRTKAITTPYDLSNSTPGITATAGSSSRNDVQYFIRGQGATYGSTPSVVTYFADVPQQAASTVGGSNITFYDLESVQVLKGPQGTLFGRSTTAGAVLLTPKKPTGEFDGFLDVTLGNYALRQFTGAINIPIFGDRLAVRIAGDYSAHDGFARSLTTGRDLDDRNRSSYRITLLARPTDWLTNTTIFSDINVKESGTASILGNYEPNGITRAVVDPRLPGGFGVTGSLLDTRAGGIYDPTGFIFSAANGGVTNPALAGGYGRFVVQQVCANAFIASAYAAQGQSFNDCVNQRVGIINGVRTALDAEAARLAAGGSVRRLPTTDPQYLRSQVEQLINTTEVNFGEVGFLGDTTFKNIFSTTRNIHSETVFQIQGVGTTGIGYTGVGVTGNNCTPTICIGGINVFSTDSMATKWFDVWSEEAQLSGRINGKHDWILGYFTEHTNRDSFQNQPSVFGVLNGALTLPAGLPGVSSGYKNPYKASQTGYFGQTTIDFSDLGLDGVRFTAGFRHSIVKQSLTAFDALLPATGLIQNPFSQPVDAALKQTANSYTFALDYKVRPGVLLYATTRKGFKQGGINTQAVLAANAGVPGAVAYFGPETVTDYEAGIKTDYEIGTVGLRTNLALFQSDYSGLQRSSVYFDTSANTSATQITNAAKMRTRGIELEQIFRLSHAFTVNVNYAYLDAKFVDFQGFVLRPSDGAVVPRSQSAIQGAPKHKLDVAARYAYDAGDAGDFALSGNVSYQSRITITDSDLSSLTPEQQAPYATANLRLDWNNVMGNPIDVGLFGKNIFDKTFRIGSGNLIASNLGTTTYIYGDPATYGIQIRVRFGESARR